MPIQVMAAFGVVGLAAVWSGLSFTNNSSAFFSIMETLPSWANAFVLVLGMALVASSVDTIQSGLAATVTTDILMNKTNFVVARIAAALINIPCIVIALLQFDVLQLFLIADLIAAIIVCPVCLGLSGKFDRILNGFDFIVAFIGGFVSVIGFGWVYGGSFMFGIRLLTLPNGLAV